MISHIAKLLVALNNNSRPSELASGAAFGFWLALIPGGNLLWAGLFGAAFLIKHNLAALFLSLGLFKLLAPLSAPLAAGLGERVLLSPALREGFTALYNTPLLPYTNFNHTLVMGGFLLGILCWGPLFGGFLLLIRAYKARAASRFAESRAVKGLQKIPLVSKVTKAVRSLSEWG